MRQGFPAGELYSFTEEDTEESFLILQVASSSDSSLSDVDSLDEDISDCCGTAAWQMSGPRGEFSTGALLQQAAQTGKTVADICPMWIEIGRDLACVAKRGHKNHHVSIFCLELINVSGGKGNG